jgi:hypothetical protein
MRAAIIGVSVRETTAEMTIVTASVTANSRKRRPTMSPMKSSGIRTAMSDTVSERMVKPICARALERGLHRRLAFLDVARDVLDHDDGVVHDEAGRDRQRHHRQVVEAVAERIHGCECADQRERNGHARDDRGVEAPQEKEDDQDDEATVNSNSNSTSDTEASMAVVRSVSVVTCGDPRAGWPRAGAGGA